MQEKLVVAFFTTEKHKSQIEEPAPTGIRSTAGFQVNEGRNYSVGHGSEN